MFNLIVAHNSNYGIGFEGKIPWHANAKSDLRLFRELTRNSILIVGRKTAEFLPKLEDRMVICLSRSGNLTMDNNNNCTIFPDIFQDQGEELLHRFHNLICNVKRIVNL